jgi:hypothetical protein
MMDETKFWQIIDTSREQARQMSRGPTVDFLDLHEQTLAEALRKLAPEGIAGFDEQFWRIHRLAYCWDLWAAAYWLHGGCSNDGFIDFRACLVSLGKGLFLQILEDPDTLADLADRFDIPYMQAEGFQYVASKVYREKTGQSIPEAAGEHAGPPPEPAGERIDHDDVEVMRRRFPKLVARYPEMGD